VFSCEASAACISTFARSLFYCLTNTSPSFVYETKKSRGKAHIDGFKVVKALLCLQSIDSFIREEGPDSDISDSDEEVDPGIVRNPLVTLKIDEIVSEDPAEVKDPFKRHKKKSRSAQSASPCSDEKMNCRKNSSFDNAERWECNGSRRRADTPKISPPVSVSNFNVWEGDQVTL
jgi:hypothetical protein